MLLLFWDWIAYYNETIIAGDTLTLVSKVTCRLLPWSNRACRGNFHWLTINSISDTFFRDVAINVFHVGSFWSAPVIVTTDEPERALFSRPNDLMLVCEYRSHMKSSRPPASVPYVIVLKTFSANYQMYSTGGFHSLKKRHSIHNISCTTRQTIDSPLHRSLIVAGGWLYGSSSIHHLV